MDIGNLLTLNKDNKSYYCRIIDFSENSDKMKLQLLSKRTSRNFSIFENDIIDLELKHKERVCHFTSKVLYHDKINHFLTIEKPTEAVCDLLNSVINLEFASV